MNNNDDKRQRLLLDIMTNNGATRLPESTDELLQPWRRLAGHLSPLIGESGFCALYMRATRLLDSDFGWLASGQSCRSIDRALAALGERFDAVETLAAQAGNAALLNTFTKLLSDLIGEALTTRLLASAANGDDGQKNAQEHK
jgi:hypothetical protein